MVSGFSETFEHKTDKRGKNKVLSKKEKCLSDEDARNAGGGGRLEERGEIMQIGENVIYN